ncbi:MAG TPA: response regulator [Puia sp.]|jgi:DNA-binding NarL/FixJ family response regulator|nr:response regulator [Puia sp.]
MAGKAILIVDDSPLITDRLYAMLRNLNNVRSLDHASECSSAIRHLTESIPDIVLLDINLPGCSGLYILRYIKSHHPGIVVIMLTNQVDGYYRKKCKELGADDFIDKSKEFEKVPGIISSLL